MNTKYSVQKIKIADLTISLQVFAHPEQEFDRHFTEVDTSVPEPPLYGCLWPSAEGLAHYLVPFGSALKGCRVLEIGCGLALPSLALASLGAIVTAMDHHPGVMELLAFNAQLNGLAPLRTVIGSFADSTLMLGSFDLIIGSDILYEPQTYPDLEAFILRHAGPHARIVVADPGRYAVEKFGTPLKARGEFQIIPQLVPGQERPIEIRVFSLKERETTLRQRQDKIG